MQISLDHTIRKYFFLNEIETKLHIPVMLSVFKVAKIIYILFISDSPTVNEKMYTFRRWKQLCYLVSYIPYNVCEYFLYVCHLLSSSAIVYYNMLWHIYFINYVKLRWMVGTEAIFPRTKKLHKCMCLTTIILIVIFSDRQKTYNYFWLLARKDGDGMIAFVRNIRVYMSFIYALVIAKFIPLTGRALNVTSKWTMDFPKQTKQHN